MENLCWWCGAQADSREHIFKKTDQTRVYGKGPYTKGSQPLMQSGPNTFHIVQGPNSDYLKFKANLCKDCNNNRSSEFDKSYSHFIDGIKPYYEDIKNTGELELTNIYQSNCLKNKAQLLKYYVKHIGCRLSHDGINVPKNLINYLDDKEDLLDIKIQFEIRPLNYSWEQTQIESNLQPNTFEVLKVGQAKVAWLNTKEIAFYLSWLTTGWVSVNYIVEKDININAHNGNVNNTKLLFRIGPIMPPIDFFNSTMLEKIDIIEEIDRISTNDICNEFYTRVRSSTI